ncbi:MAG: LysM domain-containing protein [Methylobacter sp.]|uniref:LysM domain-containing protein n=1 Tax=Candidatus Methylobacter titanis TaxID=3053457 RepID=A0AA43Q0L0_9GAMM|nr:LysM domain-containing protein [Candidatus Methylobacter titanis]MDI1292346.1 LysM domain-containing protein [Candidatus Methylobacter titanis]
MTESTLALQQLLQLGGAATMFPPTSRYYGLATVLLETGAGTKTAYLQRRWVPQPERFDLLQEHTVTQGERLDNITAQYLGDPEQFWRLCDANRALHPRELEQFGRKLRITLPEGVPGMPNA